MFLKIAVFKHLHFAWDIPQNPMVFTRVLGSGPQNRASQGHPKPSKFVVGDPPSGREPPHFSVMYAALATRPQIIDTDSVPSVYDDGYTMTGDAHGCTTTGVR